MSVPSETFTTIEKLEAVRRELKLRRAVYPRLVQTGRMTAEAMRTEIAIFEAITADYTARARAEGALLV